LINKYLNHKPLQYGKKFYLLEFLAERFIQVVAVLSIGFIIAIFYYVFQEAAYAFKTPEKHEMIIDNSNSKTISSNNNANTPDENFKSESYNPDSESGNGNRITDEDKPEQYVSESYNPDSEPVNGSDKVNREDNLKPESYSPELDVNNKTVSKTEPANNVEQSKPDASNQNINIDDKKSLEDSYGEQSVTIKKLLSPNDYIENKPEYIWQPISEVPKYSFIPLFIGALKITLIGLVIAAPIAILAALFTVAFAPKWLKEIIKPAIEILAGFPSVVLGFFCLITLATVIQELFNTTYRLNSFVGGIGMALAVIPIIYTITEDALSAVPKFMYEGSLALGASRWQTVYRVILPAATPGVFAALILGFGRAFGETMIALMASGNAALVSMNVFESVRTMAATVGAEMAEVEFHSVHYGVLFLIGAVLFVVTFSLNAIAEFYIRKKLMKKFQGN
jgi:phosphate transport system permease protein